MKKILFLIITLGMSISTIMAESGTCGDNLTWDLTDGVLTISGTGNMNNYSYNGSPWYSLRSTITSVTIGNSVTSIGECAFRDCSGLTSVTIGNSVANIGSQAFGSCSGLTSIEIPNSVTSIGDYAFGDCSGLVSIVIPNNVTSIGGYAFQSCTNLISIEIPNGVTSIGMYAFDHCSKLTSIAIPNSVISIGSSAFSNCTNLTSVELPNGITSIEMYTFDECTSLTFVAIPHSVTSIGENAFYGCQGLTFIEIPNSVISIGTWAFAQCSGLTSIAIPDSITNIGNYAFSNCAALDTVYCYAETPPTLGTNVFNKIKNTAILYVYEESLAAYSAISGYADGFAEIRGIKFGESEVENITSHSVDIKWKKDADVIEYTVNVYTKGTLYVSYVIDNAGHILSPAPGTPTVHRAPMDTTYTTDDYHVLTLDGLNSGTDYTYTINGTDVQGVPVYHESGTFHTQDDTEFIPYIETEDKSRQTQKILCNGQIYILRGEERYTIQGTKLNQ